MFTFLNGLILPALAAASIPIILHLLSRKKARKIPFSSIKFLKSIENQRIKKVKLYQILLILVRTLFIIFLVLAFARPTIDSFSGDTGASAQTTAVIIVDDSYSMQAFASSQTFFEIARKKLRELLSVFKTDDRIYLCSTGFKNPVQINDVNIDVTLKNLAAGNASISINKSLQAADSLFKSNININNELYIISDFKIPQQTIDDSLNFDDLRNFNAYKIPIIQETNFHNRSIDSVIVANQLIEINKRVKLDIFLSNHDMQSISETSLDLYDDGERVAMDYISFEAAESKKVELNFVPKSTGIHHLKLEIDEDDLALDNSYYFSLYLKEKVNALFVSDFISQPIQIALDLLAEKAPFKFQNAQYNEWLGIDLNLFDLLVFNDIKVADKNFLLKLADFIKSGRSVIIIPGETLTINSYNELFQGLSNRLAFGGIVNAGSNSFFSIENEKNANTLFNALFREQNSSFRAPRLFKYIKQKNYEKSLITLENKDVLLSKTGSLYVFSNSFKLGWTDFETNGLFVPLLYRIFYLASQPESTQLQNKTIDDDIIFEVKNMSIDNRFEIQNPENEVFTLIPETRNNRLYFNAGKANVPGFYKLISNNQMIASMAVNHSASELKRPFMQDENLGFQMYDLTEKNIIETITTARIGFELWILFLILAFIMIISEMILIKKIEGTSFSVKI